MDSSITPVNVQILGKEYTVACPAGQENSLLASARKVDAEMRMIRESGKVLGNDRIAVMVSLNLAHELLNLQQASGNSQAAPVTPVSTGIDEGQTLQQLQRMQIDIEAALELYQPAARAG